jgi:hypothetical protein
LPELLAARTILEPPGLSFHYEPVEAGLAVTARKASDGILSGQEEKAAAVLEWTFGAGSHGLTPVGRFQDTYFEHRITYYPSVKALAATPGHSLSAPRSAREGLGRVQSAANAYRCFACHATDVRAGSEGPDLRFMQAGVQCERCHGPGAASVAAARSGDGETARRIGNPARLDSRRQVEMCGECHHLPKPGPISLEPEKEDVTSVRFQPLGLLASRCFRASEALSCTSCHSPHEDASKDPDYYTAKCLECHAPEPAARVGDCRRANKENCLPCHMRVAAPEPHLLFTDHRIRVY